MKSYFLNVDLDIVTKSKAALDLIAEEMGDQVRVLHSGPAIGKGYLLAVEIAALHKNPDATIHALCSVVEQLSPAAQRVWNKAKKQFDVGCELRSSERCSRFTLKRNTLERMTKLGATLAVTYYRDGNDSD